MIPRSQRLSTQKIKGVMEKGRVFHGPFFSLRAEKTSLPSRFSVSVPKQVAKTAVGRNKIRRSAYSALKKIFTEPHSGYNGLVVVKKGAEKLLFEDLTQSLKDLFVKSGILK